MAFTPESIAEIVEDTEVEALDEQDNPVVKTYSLDFENGVIGKLVDGTAAIRQIVTKSLMTDRFKYIVYSEDYGSELRELIGEDLSESLLDAEIPRMVSETLIYDERIGEVTDIEFSREGDSLFISVTVVPAEGGDEVTTEVVI